MLVLVPPTAAGALLLSGVRTRSLELFIQRSVEPVLPDASMLPDWSTPLELDRPILFIAMAFFAIAVVIAVAASIVTPTAIARRIIAPIVVALATVPGWFGARLVLDAQRIADVESAAVGAMLLGLALSCAVLGVWVGIGSTAGGLAAVPLTAFIGVVAPLAALGVVALGPEVSNPLVSGPARAIFAMHWIASLALAASALLGGFMLVRTATYRRT
jgi:hypothetical protein